MTNRILNTGNRILSIRIPFYYVLIPAILIIVLIIYNPYKSKARMQVTRLKANINKPVTYSCDYTLQRLNGYNYIKPLMFAEPDCESLNLNSLKKSLNKIIEQFKVSGRVNSASVFIKKADEDEWMSIENNAEFDPASLIKIPIMISFLRIADDNPTILERKLIFEKQYINPYKQIFNSKRILHGNQYTIKELLKYMIAYSDNDAANLLMANLNEKEFLKTFSDMGLPVPEKGSNFPLTARDISLFMNILYDAHYLSIKNSEFAINLLRESDFKEGIIAGIPQSVKVAHKFGEKFDNETHQLHETAIVYSDKTTYLITVMTKGNDVHNLASLIKYISKTAYESLSAN